MPEFSDLLLEEVKNKKSEIERVLAGGDSIFKEYAELVSKKWNPLPAPTVVPRNIYAVDSSSGVIELRAGGVLLVLRSLAFSTPLSTHRKLGVEAFYPHSIRDFEEYVRLAREHYEHNVALDALNENPSFILLDGSLYGRMIHVLRELDLEEREDFLFEYVKTYSQFLRKALENKVTVIGVSKDSRSTIFKEELLKEQVLQEASRFGADTSELAGLWGSLRRRPRETIESVRQKVRSGELPERILEYFLQARSHIPDSKIILLSGVEEGFSTPILLTLSKIIAGQFDLVLSEDATMQIHKLSKVFSKSYDADPEEFEARARELIGNLRSYPPVAVFYTLLGPNDDPIRVDVVSHELQEFLFLKDRPSLESLLFMPSIMEKEMIPMTLSLLQSLYAGYRGYNVLLLEADRRVKITVDTLETYRKIIMRELELLVLHSRGERRVHYP
ncbi:MAG: DNA double-strand break repair nuclease NurA [Infirmifilum sp.]